ncbi:hypothetical protein LCGC14_1742200 [marine sediment metagenome]|uniref:Uncharacterized protein n=1 Tax=marine sediment metagenome TaxID=412755 RepID=A0A0F9HTY5_9ZZZZ
MKEKKLIKVECNGCHNERLKEEGYDYSKYICKVCLRIIENIAKFDYPMLRFIADLEVDGYEPDIIKRQDLLNEFHTFLISKGYKI